MKLTTDKKKTRLQDKTTYKYVKRAGLWCVSETKDSVHKNYWFNSEAEAKEKCL